MDLAIKLDQLNGHYSAALLGNPELHAEGPTPEEAVEAIRRRVQDEINRSRILMIHVDAHPVVAMAGILKDDPTLDEMVAQIYRQRDEERIREHGE
jgi:hypothetical protein